jgi:serine/threonine protein kinase
VIDDGGAPRITDFGLSFFDWKSSSSIETKTRIMVGSFASGDISAVLAAASAYTRSGAGSPRWMGPELLVPEAFHKMSTRPTFESDVFSFRMLIYEVLQLYLNPAIVNYFYRISTAAWYRSKMTPT